MHGAVMALPASRSRPICTSMCNLLQVGVNLAHFHFLYIYTHKTFLLKLTFMNLFVDLITLLILIIYTSFLSLQS